jgi:signal transduction histidine kinase
MIKFRTIFHKLFVYYLCILLVSFGSLAFLLDFTIQELLIRKKESSLQAKADNMIALLKQDHSLFESRLLELKVPNAFRINDIRVHLLLLNRNDSKQLLKIKRNLLLKRADLRDPKLLEQVLAGERVREIGVFRSASNEVLLTVGIPVIEDNRVVGALFLNTPVQEIPTREITAIILLLSLFIALPSSLLLYWLSSNLSRPLVRMNNAAQRIGRGHLQERIPVEGNDEVGQLTVAFNQMAAQLEQLEQMRKELIMNVSHELRTPLTSVRGYIQAMKDGVIPADQYDRYLDICNHEIKRLSALLNTMLDLSAIESGQLVLQPVLIRWNSLVADISDRVTIRMEEKHISFTIKQATTEPITVYGDAERLIQVLFNLLDNAIRHTPDYGEISILSTKKGPWVEVQIADTGSGISKEQLPHIWERFYSDKRHKSGREQSGLGLTITKQLVELMGGTITVDSVIGQGSVFTLRLPSTPFS